MHLMHNQAFKLTTEALGLPEGIFRHPQVLDGLDGLVRICEWP